MSDCNPSPTPFQCGVNLIIDRDNLLVDATLYIQLVRSLIYLTHIKPYLYFAFGMVSIFRKNPHEIHWKAIKSILIYLQGTMHDGVFYSSRATVSILGYKDFD